MEKLRLTEADICPRCGLAFHCSKSARCWCFEVQTSAHLLEYVQQQWQSCLCPSCLEAVAKALEKGEVNKTKGPAA